MDPFPELNKAFAIVTQEERHKNIVRNRDDKAEALSFSVQSSPMQQQRLRVFGCLCYVHHKPRNNGKFAPPSKRFVFLGYPFGQKGWSVLDLETRTISTSRDVSFIDTFFPFAMAKPLSTTTDVVENDYFLDDELPHILDRGSLVTTPVETPPPTNMSEQTLSPQIESQTTASAPTTSELSTTQGANVETVSTILGQHVRVE
ncbi:hypothetical protein LIER_22230 [Lithospermum erythrorhizon]|uniref:Retroviral polymerase SH3-like domain-containing protein n=1 Tax=Lithospermum erythrorhizon TaxID=34254 RepID=A0AAV3QW72_LITER